MKIRVVALLGTLLWGACNRDKDADGPALNEGPEISHEAPADRLVDGDDLSLVAEVSDANGVSQVVVYHRTDEDDYWQASYLENSDGDEWSATLGPLMVPGLQYYFKAVDKGDPAAVSYLPEGAPDEIFALDVDPESTPLPFVEDFEPADGEVSLHGMGWWVPTENFDAYPWQLTDSRSYGGDYAAFHPRGYDGVGELSDWLISPALDLRGVDGAMVTWQEYGVGTESIYGHSVLVSTGSRDPGDGEFTEIEVDLGAPEEKAWGRSVLVDLSAWVGEPVVYLGWRWTGEEADDWYIDDISVRALGPDLTASISWSPDPVGPGETAEITVTVSNGSSAGAESVVASLSLPEGGGTVEEDSVAIGAIDAGSTGEGVFTLTLDGDLEDNRYLPLELTLSDGSDTWIEDHTLTVGLESTGEVTLSLDDAGSVEVVFGYGDPDEPDAEFQAWAGSLDAGEHTLSADLTDAYASLPPAPGELRWFVRVDANVAGTVSAATIVYDGQRYLADAPESFDEDDALDLFIPDPPDPDLTRSSPDEALPGETIELELVVTNQGESSSGAVTAVLSSDDADVTVLTTDSFVLDADAWAADESHYVTGLRVAISDDHVDSTPVQLQLTMQDEIESWTLEFEVDVPWAVMRVITIEIDDDGGDGILDADEAATLKFTLANTGDQDSYGVVYGSLSAESSSTASAAIDGTSTYFGSMSVGRERSASFEVQVTGGASGDTLDLLLTLDDNSGAATYTATTQLVLGEPPWQVLSTGDDSAGDNLDNYGWDFINGQYRVVDGEVQIRLESNEEYDSSTLFIEAWGRASGAEYTYYRWVVTAGSTTFEGYTSSAGFDTIGTLDVSFESDTVLQLSWPAEDMGLLTNAFSLGLASGWCGAPDYYCDHFPDGWGYPYDSFSTGDWFSVRW